MKQAIILIGGLILILSAGMVQAQEELHGRMDVRYLSSYIWRGFDLYPDDHSASQAQIDIDLYGSGFGITTLWSNAIHGGFENDEWIVPGIYYQNAFMKGQTLQTNYRIIYNYYNYPDQPRAGSSSSICSDMQEIVGAFSWPNLLGNGVVPSYTAVRMWTTDGDAASRNLVNGWAHIFGLDYSLMVPGFTGEQEIDLHAEAVYNDSVGPCPLGGGAAVDHDWSHAVFGASTAFELNDNLTFKPGLFYQST